MEGEKQQKGGEEGYKKNGEREAGGTKKKGTCEEDIYEAIYLSL